MANIPEPITRTEQYYSYMAGESSYLPDPITREEKYLYYLCKNGTGGCSVTPEQIQQAVDEYLTENPVSGMTEEQEEQLNQATEDILTKVDKDQGTENAGKVLGIGSDGMVTLVDGTGGTPGPAGVGIQKIKKTGTEGLVDTYTITYTNGQTSTYTVTNGATGEKGDTGDTGPQGETGAQGPKGDTGATPNIQIGTVQTLEPGQQATASMSGTPENPLLNLGIPKGATGGGEGGGGITEETDPTVPAWAKEPTKPTYTAVEVGADASGTAVTKVSEHNTAADAHSDIRLLVQGLTARLNTLADSDDDTLDQMSEIVAYIKSNKTLIDAITTQKVNVADIIDNLTTNVGNKPLSASQGVKLKGLIDAIVIPEKLPNPGTLKFTGAVTETYDGSADKTIDIPLGGGSGGGETGTSNYNDLSNKPSIN